MKIGIIVLIILALGVVGYGLFRSGEEPATTPTPSASTVPADTQTPTPSLIVTQTPTPTGVVATPTQTVTPVPSLSPTVTPIQTLTPTPIQTPTPTPAPTTQSHLILMQNRAYDPSTLTVTKGDAVVFRAVDTFYSVIVTGRSSGRLQPGQEWTLNSGDFLPGTYSISDATYTTMRGTLVIQ